VYYVACTIDGYIARADGSRDWALPDGEHFADLIAKFPETFPVHLREALGITHHPRRFGAVLMGRKTYEVGANAGITSPYAPLCQYVVSRSMSQTLPSTVHLHRGAALALVRQLKAEDGKDVWLCGGSTLAASLFCEVDELILKINPVVIGSGIPLFDGRVHSRPTTLAEHKVYANGFVLARYDLHRQRASVAEET